MTAKGQEAAFERELHALCSRFLDEWDIPMLSMLALLELEQYVILSLIADRVDQCDIKPDPKFWAGEDVDEPTGDWGLNGEEYE